MTHNLDEQMLEPRQKELELNVGTGSSFIAADQEGDTYITLVRLDEKERLWFQALLDDAVRKIIKEIQRGR